MAKMMLDNLNISKAMDISSTFMDKHHVEHKNSLRISLYIEELLLRYQTQFGEETQFDIECKKSFGRLQIIVTVDETQFNPLALAHGEESAHTMHRMLENLGVEPSYAYEGNKNKLIFSPMRKKYSPITGIAVAIVAAVAFGLLCHLLPSFVIQVLSEQILQGIFNKFIGVLNALAGPLIFLSILYGIFGMGDMVSFSRIGKHILARYFITLISLMIVTSFIFYFFTETTLVDNSATTSISTSVFGLFGDVIPDNLVKPFVDNNTMQITFIAIILGIVILALKEKTTALVQLVEQGNCVINRLMEFMEMLMPMFVFISLFSLFLNDEFYAFLQSYKLALIIVFGCIFILTLYTIIVSLRLKVHPMILIKKQLSSFLIALTTASSSAAFMTTKDCCENQLGIDERIVSFGLPLGQVVFKPTGGFILFMLSIFMANAFHVPITFKWLVLDFIISFVLAIATPPIPGGDLACMTMLFVQLGIPLEAMGGAIVLDLIFDFMETGTSLVCRMNTLLLSANSLNLLDEDILKKQKVE